MRPGLLLSITSSFDCLLAKNKLKNIKSNYIYMIYMLLGRLKQLLHACSSLLKSDI